MPRKPDIERLKTKAIKQLEVSCTRYEKAHQKRLHYLLLRWIASMTAVEVYAIWERYAERRLTTALVHHPQKFLADNNVRGLKSIPVGLATVLIRGGNRYFDFRSTSDLIRKGDRLVGKPNNPFRNLPAQLRDYIDTLSAIRNYIVHQSDSALASYKNYLTNVYDVKSKPGPNEFLNSIDYRPDSPARRRPRLVGLIEVVKEVINLS